MQNSLLSIPKGVLFVVRGCASEGGRREVPIENRIFNRGFSRSAGLSVIRGFLCRAEPG